jgi:hypothetical protein
MSRGRFPLYRLIAQVLGAVKQHQSDGLGFEAFGTKAAAML